MVQAVTVKKKQKNCRKECSDINTIEVQSDPPEPDVIVGRRQYTLNRPLQINYGQFRASSNPNMDIFGLWDLYLYTIYIVHLAFFVSALRLFKYSTTSSPINNVIDQNLTSSGGELKGNWIIPWLLLIHNCSSACTPSTAYSLCSSSILLTLFYFLSLIELLLVFIFLLKAIYLSLLLSLFLLINCLCVF